MANLSSVLEDSFSPECKVDIYYWQELVYSL